MKLKKRSQITLIMAIVVAIIVIFSVFYFVSRSSARKKLGAEVEGEVLKDVQPVREFVQQCLERTAKDGIILLGKQTGRIYESQGGLYRNYGSAENRRYIFAEKCHKGYNRDFDCYIPYGLEVPICSESAPISPKCPGGGGGALRQLGDQDTYYYSKEYQDATTGNNYYPSKRFPYKDNDNQKTTPKFNGLFGDEYLIILKSENSGFGAVGQQGIDSMLKKFIETRIFDCAKFEDFESRGYKINLKKEDVSANAIISNRDVRVILNFPMDVGIGANEKEHFSEFSTILNVRLGDIYYTAKSIIERDRLDIGFELPLNENDFGIAARNSFNGNEIVTLTDVKDESKIDGNAYEFRFARRNRGPALFHFFDDGKCLIKNKGEKIEEKDVIEYIEKSYPCPSGGNCCNGGIAQCLMELGIVIDPDEDRVIGQILKKSKEPLDTSVVSPTEIRLNAIEDKDNDGSPDSGGLEDWQMIKVREKGEDCSK